MSFFPLFSRCPQLCLLNSTHYWACLVPGKSLILVIPVIPCFLSHEFILLFSFLIFLMWFCFVANILALHVRNFVLFFKTIFLHFYTPISISMSSHLSPLYETMLIHFFLVIFSSSYSLYFTSSIPLCFDPVVIFLYFHYVPEVNIGELLGPSCAQTWRLPFPSSNSSSAFGLVALSKYEHGIL